MKTRTGAYVPLFVKFKINYFVKMNLMIGYNGFIRGGLSNGDIMDVDKET